MGQIPSAKISAGYYKGPVTLMNNVNKNRVVCGRIRHGQI